jgi:Novel toxin 16
MLQARHIPVVAYRRCSSRKQRFALSQPALNHATSVTSSRWHGTFNLPVLSTEPNRRVTVTYDVKGNITSFVDSTTVDPTGSIAAAGIASPSGAPTTLTNSAAVTRITRSQATGWAYNAQQLPSTATLATSVTTSASAASTNTLLYSYDRSHKVVSIKWNGTEQYASTGVARLLGSLTNEATLTNGELATRLGVTTLEPLTMSRELGIKLSASTVNLAKDAVLGREAKAAAPLVLIIPFAPEIGGALTAWGIRTGVMAVGAYGASQVMGVDWGSSGAASQIGQYTQDADGITREGKNEICLNGNPDPDKCNGLYKAYKAAKKEASALGGCNGAMTNSDDRLARKKAIQKEIDTRQAHMKDCFNGGDERHLKHIVQRKNALANCS